MEKLIELLLECKPQIHYLDKPKGVYDKRYGIGWYKREGDIGGWFSEENIISKKFGFIKWLVDNDKIDKKKIDTRLVKHVDSHYNEEGYWVENSYEDYSIEDILLMLFAISDTPINDLISYLK